MLDRTEEREVFHCSMNILYPSNSAIDSYRGEPQRSQNLRNQAFRKSIEHRSISFPRFCMEPIVSGQGNAQEW